jgi:hypothetical protein
MKGKRKIVKIATISTVVAFVVAFSLIVFAEHGDSSKTMVLKVEGIVDVNAKGTSKPVALIEGMKLSVGDVVTTDTESSVKFKLNDGSVVNIGSDSRVVIKEPGQIEITKVSLSTFEIVKGKIKALVKPFINKECKFNIERQNEIDLIY